MPSELAVIWDGRSVRVPAAPENTPAEFQTLLKKQLSEPYSEIKLLQRARELSDDAVLESRAAGVVSKSPGKALAAIDDAVHSCVDSKSMMAAEQL